MIYERQNIYASMKRRLAAMVASKNVPTNFGYRICSKHETHQSAFALYFH